ncbi:hypothetical protein GH714_004354 [Hevea brasiliensis]|uniref:Uncharacterized protein n=1 Tax=Hevea brasiliensis TaxID=3981 RepID=A0A6A6KJ52_HEVBR|nr:hypothetical protein GH714_004354 [Hevea brasiliensis]
MKLPLLHLVHLVIVQTNLQGEVKETACILVLVEMEAVSGAEKGEPAAIAISPRCSISLNAAESSRHQSGSLFTLFLTTPLRAFCLLIGLSGSDIEMDTYNMAEKLLSSSLNDWGSTLANLDALDPVWAQILGDPFLRRLLLRKEWIPECMHHLPASLLPTAIASQTVVLQMANIFSATKKFIFSEGTVLPEYIHSDDTEIRQKKNECYADIESGLWGQQCKSSMTAKENCALRCLSPTCYELIYESDPLEEGEKDLVRSQGTSTVVLTCKELSQVYEFKLMVEGI